MRKYLELNMTEVKIMCKLVDVTKINVLSAADVGSMGLVLAIREYGK